jgi:pimeloyl-ACP methyl ester carboxylesterase
LGAVGAADEDRGEDLEWAATVRREGSGFLADSLKEIEPTIPDWFLDQMRSTDPEMFALMLEGWASWGGPWSEFRYIDVPTLIVVGELEEDAGGLAGTNARHAAELMSQGRALVLPNLAHCMAFVRSDLVAPAVNAFLNEPR